ncbi:carboxynorspermidine decarboxylase [Lachnospira pectinoschiza]|uniref:Carboxynorspermidine decarboxylase n=1 Tax=Lachnospira pectinoschiza TaxID=28052 RepID=A0A1G9Y6G7_9FIRM|nr:carboxynorspermidine decarboxylase [Lachnospira pectinoschiza]SDN04630.1 carboxynorspermidine decarboxylase [Lachnospira pectinoschiza]
MNIRDLKTPAYVIDENKLEENLKVLESVEKAAGCKILLAQKAFSNFYTYPLISKYISGTTASGLYEARLGKEEMGKENHVFAPAFKDEDMEELVKICDHIVFNSISQLEHHRPVWQKAGVSVGLRINPEFSTQGDHAIYDPCAPGSRFGVTLKKLEEALEANPRLLDGVEGIHFHTLCEQDSDDLEATLEVVLEKFDFVLKGRKWINFGGGHHITREDYDIETLIRCINQVKARYNCEVYLEPGEAIALNAGYLVTTVLDKVDNGIETLILDASAACHMPDVLEMPYVPPLKDALKVEDTDLDIWTIKKMYKNGISPVRAMGKQIMEGYSHVYRLSSFTCLAGDIIGDYCFKDEINIGDKLIFEDMAIYSMVKNNTFNGIPLPSIATMKDGDCRIIKEFGYEDFKGRLS